MNTDKLNGDDWVRLLKVFPQFAKYCNWEKLSRKNWIDLLEAHPEFADKCGDIQLIYDVFAEAQYKPIQRDIETLIESQNVERKERLWAFIPLGISFLLWGVGCIAFYCERATDMALIIWWTLFCSWNGVLLLFEKEKFRIKMEMGSCQCHCMGTADAVFYYRLYDLSRSFLRKSVIFDFETSHICM